MSATTQSDALKPPGEPGGYAQPKALSGAARALALLRMSSVTAAAVVGGIVIANAVLSPSSWAPGTLLGELHAAITSATLNGEREAQQRSAAAMARANAAAAAEWQMKHDAMLQELQARLQSLQMQIAAANVADGICMGAPLVQWLFGHDGDRAAAGMSQTCGQGDIIRQNIAREIAEVMAQIDALMQATNPYGQPAAAPP